MKLEKLKLESYTAFGMRLTNTYLIILCHIMETKSCSKRIKSIDTCKTIPWKPENSVVQHIVRRGLNLSTNQY